MMYHLGEPISVKVTSVGSGLTDVRPQIVSRVAARSSSMRRLGCNGRGSDFHYVPRKHKEGKA